MDYLSRYLLFTVALPACLLLLAGAAFGATKDTNFSLVKDGQPAATIVVSSTPNRSAWFAAGELQSHVKKITGVTLPIVNDAQPVQGRVILVGASKRTDALGLHNKDFAQQEYLVRIQPDVLVLMGHDNDSGAFPLQVWGNPGHSAGKFGKALKLDGAQDTLALQGHNFPDDAGTFECWTEVGGGQGGTLMWIEGQPWTYHGLVLESETRVIKYITYDGKEGSAIESKPLTDGWHHVMITWDATAGKKRLFIDGALAADDWYRKTQCSTAQRFSIGGRTEPAFMPNGVPVNLYHGALDELKLSRGVHEPSPAMLTTAPTADADTILLLHGDEATAGAPADASGRVVTGSRPDTFEQPGTCYAVYDFLEKFCGVRWYAPTELGLVYPRQTTLTVSGKEIRRKPAISYRWNTGLGAGYARTLLNNPSGEEWALWNFRLRAGGRALGGNHGLYGYYDRFWTKNPQNAGAFEAERHEFFAKGYNGTPPQLCYTNPALIAQVAKDINDYFDGKGGKNGMNCGSDWVCIEPMDNDSMCKCPDCQALFNKKYADDKDFTNGQWSNYIFNFVNKVAHEVGKTHPDKYVMALAYFSHSYPPEFALEPNIISGSCLGTRTWLSPADPKAYTQWIKQQQARQFSEPKAYKQWIAESKKTGRILSMWLYHCFPQETGDVMGFHVFPGFHAHTLANQLRMFADDGIKGVFTCGVGEQVDCYLTNKLLDDPHQDVDKLLHEFFTRYYGKAGEPLEKVYRKIEATYGDPRNYPKGSYDCSERVCWENLGTEARMQEMSGWVAQAKQLAADAPDGVKQRVALFDEGLWKYMTEGREGWVKKAPYVDEVERLKQAAPPTLHVPRIANGINGDPEKVDWSKGVTEKIFRSHEGFPTERKVEMCLLHDDAYLYVRLVDHTSELDIHDNSGIFWNDRWEIFAAAQREKPYRQLGVKPDGQHVGLAFGEDLSEWRDGFTVKVTTDTAAWTTLIAFPLAKLSLHGIKPGDKLYMNFYRPSSAGKATLAWSPHFGGSYHNPARLGELVLE